ncbi:MAG: nuclear transport factor 2 family protein [Nitrospirae bacterium]|nr:nuclear transport factor 2 family protein [Nitrospirota bacterium]MDA1303275.1 nuclear transport factor 2 family protein [Nitrospirota bacterium]
MSALVEVAKAMAKAWEEKDEAAFRACLHADYSFKGPMMEMNSVDEAIHFMNRCPFESTTENCEVVVEGQKLVHIFDWNVTAPFQATIPMVEVMEFEGEKVKHARLFFDSAFFPAELKAQMMAKTAA